TPAPSDAPAQEKSDTDRLQPVVVEAPRRRPRSASTAQTAQTSASRPPPAASVATNVADSGAGAVQGAWPVSGTQNARTGTVGIYSNSTPVATKINTPLVNIPQSVSVVTREFINDTSFQNLTDITRYVPGVAVHQGEGNRDELIIRGVDSSANFFV